MKFNKKKNLPENENLKDKKVNKKDKKGVVKGKYRNIINNIKLSVIGVLSLAIIGVSGTVIEYNHRDSNQIFLSQKVRNDLRFYGGDQDYVTVLYNCLMLKDNKFVNHITVKKGQKIKVGIDEKSMSEGEIRAAKDVLAYFNDIFKIINPDYQFDIGNYSQKEAKIFINSKEIPDHYSGVTEITYDRINNSNLKRIEVSFNANDSHRFSYMDFKQTMIHEMMHVMMSTNDTADNPTNNLSVINYTDISHIRALLKKASNEFVNNPENEGKENIYENFTSLMPIDLSVLIAVYGDSSKPENVIKYLQLIYDTAKNCDEIFGDKFERYFPNFKKNPYYHNFELPQIVTYSSGDNERER